MLQLLQHLGSGLTELAEVPAPGPQENYVLIQTTRSLVSLGTERMLVEFGRASWFEKARQQPEKFRAVLQKVRADGLLPTISAVRSKLAQPIPLGYCQVGTVLDAGGSAGFAVGDRVVSNGPHAEVVAVRPDLVAKIPADVTDDQAVFTPLAAIALQGIGLLAPQAGDRVVVTGLGLIGQLAVQILRAEGCQVFGIDPDADKCAAAARAGAEVFVLAPGADPVAAALGWSGGQGAAGVLITASTSSAEPANQAARMCRFRGRVVLVGVVGLSLNRADFYRNEVSFQVSNSYGVRDARSPHSAQANFQKVLQWMSAGVLDTAGLISARHPLSGATEAYADLRHPRTLGVVLEYSPCAAALRRQVNVGPGSSVEPGLAVVGAGNFTVRTLLPALAAVPGPRTLRWIVSAQGASALFAARKFGAVQASTDFQAALADPQVGAVFLTTRHHQHAPQGLAALRAGKHLWVEKPLALTESDIAELASAARASGKVLMVGFNRRFAPLAAHLRSHLAALSGPREFRITVNAGALPADHWTLPSAPGGGRIVGEACHFVDLLRFLAASPIASVRALSRGTDGQDAGRFAFVFANGDTATLSYLTDLPAHVPKEVIEISGPGWDLRLDNWKSVTEHGVPGAARGGWFSSPDKGHAAALEAFLSAVQGRTPAPIPLEQIIEVSEWAVRMQSM